MTKKRIYSISRLLIQFIFISKILYSQDTLFIQHYFDLANINEEIPIVDNVKLHKDFFQFDGYLIVNLNLAELISDKESNILYCKIYWVENLENLNKPSQGFYYLSTFDITLTSLRMLYNKGKINALTAFANFYYKFNVANKDSLRTFLYKGNDALKSDHLNNSIAKYTQLNDTNHLIFIFKAAFDAAFLLYKFEKISRKVFLPISYLKEFESIEVNNPERLGLRKSDIVIRLIQ